MADNWIRQKFDPWAKFNCTRQQQLILTRYDSDFITIKYHDSQMSGEMEEETK